MLTICDTESSQNSDHAPGETWCKVKLSRKLIGESQNAHQSQKLFMCVLDLFLFSRFKIQEKNIPFPLPLLPPSVFFWNYWHVIQSQWCFSPGPSSPGQPSVPLHGCSSSNDRSPPGVGESLGGQSTCEGILNNHVWICLKNKSYLWYKYIMYNI